jgi:adenylate cyclase
MARYGRGLALTMAGRSQESLDELEAAMRLSPHDPQMWLFELLAAFASIQAGDHEAGLRWANRSIRHPAAGFYAYMALASATGHLGRHAEAHAALTRLLELKPDFSVGFVRRTWPGWNEAAVAVIAEGLAKAGFDVSDDTG